MVHACCPYLRCNERVSATVGHASPTNGISKVAFHCGSALSVIVSVRGPFLPSTLILTYGSGILSTQLFNDARKPPSGLGFGMLEPLWMVNVSVPTKGETAKACTKSMRVRHYNKVF